MSESHAPVVVRVDPASRRDARDWAYDGGEVELHTEPVVVATACPRCGSGNSFDLRAAVAPAAQLNSARGPCHIAALGQLIDIDALERVELADDSWLRTTRRLTPFGVVYRCDQCRSDALTIIGYGEFQPGRYVADIVGTFAAELSG